MILYINCCVRSNSRTTRIADALLQKLEEKYNDRRVEVNTEKENLKPLSEEILNKRDELIQQKDYSDKLFDYAKLFARADVIVISAPYWDHSFPASLKLYIENIYVTGIVSLYNEKGVPEGLCKAKKLYYVTTAGGPYNPTFSYGYIEEMAKNYFGIGDVELVKAEMLDVIGFDAEKIVESKIEEIRQREF